MQLYVHPDIFIINPYCILKFKVCSLNFSVPKLELLPSKSVSLEPHANQNTCGYLHIHNNINNFRKPMMASGMWIVCQAILLRGTLLPDTRLLPVMNVYQKVPLVPPWNATVFVFTCTNVTTNATLLIMITCASTFIMFIP